VALPVAGVATLLIGGRSAPGPATA
jgi:hypothetical protein